MQSSLISPFGKYELFLDSSAFIALADHSEQPNHDLAIEFRDKFLDGSIFRPVTSELVFAETLKHLQRMTWDGRLPSTKVDEFVDYVLRSKQIDLIQTDALIRERGFEISNSLKGQKLNFVDGTSLAIIEKKGILYTFSFDSHFTYTYQTGYNYVVVERYPS